MIGNCLQCDTECNYEESDPVEAVHIHQQSELIMN